MILLGECNLGAAVAVATRAVRHVARRVLKESARLAVAVVRALAATVRRRSGRRLLMGVDTIWSPENSCAQAAGLSREAQRARRRAARGSSASAAPPQDTTPADLRLVLLVVAGFTCALVLARDEARPRPLIN